MAAQVRRRRAGQGGAPPADGDARAGRVLRGGPGAGPPTTPPLRLLIGPFETGGGDSAANPKAETAAVAQGGACRHRTD